MNLPNTTEDYKSLTKKLAFLAVFGVTGIVAVGTYRYVKKQLSLDDIDWDAVWKDLK